MSIKNAPIVAEIIFMDGNLRFFDGSRYEKESKKLMVYHLRKMMLRYFHSGVIKEIRMFDNTKLSDRLIFEFIDGAMLRNDLASYLGADYNPKKLN